MTHYLVGDVAYPPSNAPAFKSGRPVVVIDPEDHEQVRRLGTALLNEDWLKGQRDGTGRTGDERIADALRSLLAPEKPAEPQGLGAVVEHRGAKYTKADDTGPKWHSPTEGWTDWDDLSAAVKVLSDGVVTP